MAEVGKKAVELFKAKALLAPITVVEVKDTREAFAYALDICDKKEACRPLPAGCGESRSKTGEEVCARPAGKILAAPGFSLKDFSALKKAGKERGVTVIKDGLRSQTAGIDVGVAKAALGIGESASCLVPSASEDVRLATMICEISLLLLKKSDIAPVLTDAADVLSKLFSEDARYASFISAPSKTSDIERVLTLGVHGPLELHVALLEG